jgi:signal transduction histidine kinase
MPEPVVLRPASDSILRALQKWRGFSALLSCSLTADALLTQFLMQFREITGVSRAAIFLRQPDERPGHAATPGAGRPLRAACAVGLPPGTLEHLRLNLDTGLGAHLLRHGRILWRDMDECRADTQMEREFGQLGVQVVVPILDRQTVVGLAAFDGRITGEALTHEELEVIFHVLEQLGLAIRNIWSHEQLAANQRMLADVLREFSNGCVVVGSDLAVQHCNETARRLLVGSRRETEMHFSDLPVVLGGKIYEVLKSGAALAPFRFQPAGANKAVYQISIVPLQAHGSAVSSSALMVIEDRTQMEQLHTLELEATNLRLIKSMGDRLAHEIGNALVPISTHQQLIADQYRDPDFRESLDLALAEGVKRISRLVNQMRFLSRDSLGMEETFPLGPVVEEAFRDAQTHQTVKSALLKYDDGNQPPVVSGDRAALKHAFLEVFLNALQANPNDARIAVKMKPVAGFNDQGKRWAQVEVQDNGAGFSPEAMAQAPAPFFTTRTVGLGLGLTVTRKIVETHHGRMEIVNPTEGHHGLVRIFLPQNAK